MAEPVDGSFVVTSEVFAGDEGGDVLGLAFQDRLGEVDSWPGFQRLEVWRDVTQPGSFLMVSWWDSREAWVAYMRSDAHRRSHARTPRDPGPRAGRVRRWEVVAE